MADHFLENIKKAEEALAKLQGEETNFENPDLGFGEVSKMSPDSPLVAQLKEDRMRYEMAQFEAQKVAQQLQTTKIKKAKRLGEQSARREAEKKDLHIKAKLNAVSQLNADLKEAQYMAGKICSFIDSNESTFRDSPFLKIKAQRCKRMMMAFYYGLKQASINPSKGDFLNDGK